MNKGGKGWQIPDLIRKKYEKLKSAIEHHRYIYHVLDKEEISQSALDSLKRELGEIEEKYPELAGPDSPSKRVAGKALKGFVKVVHKIPQWSFNDAFSGGDVFAWEERIKRLLPRGEKPTYVCELKIDGLKVVFEYEKGRLLRAATRG